jgi:hypothetical protein
MPNTGNPNKPQRHTLGWAEALEAIAVKKPRHVLPGHGDPLSGDLAIEVLAETARALRYLHDRVVDALNSGLWPDDVVDLGISLPADLAQKPYLAPIYGCGEFVIRDVLRWYAGWWGGDPAALLPAPRRLVAEDLLALIGKPALIARAKILAEQGEPRRALHLASLLHRAAPEDPEAKSLLGEVEALERAKAAETLAAKAMEQAQSAKSGVAAAAGPAAMAELQKAASQALERAKAAEALATKALDQAAKPGAAAAAPAVVAELQKSASQALERAKAAEALAAKAIEQASKPAAPAATPAAVAELQKSASQALERAKAAEALAAKAREQAQAAKSGAGSVAPVVLAELQKSASLALERAKAAETLAAKAIDQAQAAKSGTAAAPPAAIAELQKAIAQAVERSKAAEALAAKALEQASQAAAAPAAVKIALTTEDQKKAVADFQQFLERCEKDHRALLDAQNRLQSQLRTTLEKLPSQVDPTIQKFLDQSRGRLEQVWSGWLQHREQRATEMEGRYDAMVEKAAQVQRVLDEQLAAGTQPQHSGVAPEWAENLEIATSTHTSELRFLKTLMWITLGAVGLAYILITYAFILRS